MKSSDAAKFFDKFAVTFDTFYEYKRNFLMQWIDKRFRPDMFLRFSYTFESFGDLNNKSVIDIGCGSGIYLVEALARSANFVTGIDPAGTMLVLAKKRLDKDEYKKKFKLINSHFPFNNNNIQTHNHAIVMGVMDYIQDAKTFLSGLHKVVSDSACISFPSKHWIRTPIRKIRYDLRNCPVYFYDEEIIKKLSKQAGFNNIKINKIPGAGMDYHVTLIP